MIKIDQEVSLSVGLADELIHQDQEHCGGESFSEQEEKRR